LTTAAKPIEAMMTSKTFACFIDFEKDTRGASGSPAMQARIKPPAISTSRVSYFLTSAQHIARMTTAERIIVMVVSFFSC